MMERELVINNDHIIPRMKRFIRDAVSGTAAKISPIRWKEFNELAYWKERKKAEGDLSNSHYEYFYTSHFGLDVSFFVDKVILDIGCGPRGSLEWATMAKRRIGLDPLAKKYLELGASKHQMEYIDSPAENIPLKDAECDVVFSFNSFDHVYDIDQTAREIKRITRVGGYFLLLVEVNHAPTACEPHELSPVKLIELFEPDFKCESLEVYRSAENGMYQSIRANQKFADSMATEEIGWLSARFRRVSV